MRLRATVALPLNAPTGIPVEKKNGFGIIAANFFRESMMVIEKAIGAAVLAVTCLSATVSADDGYRFIVSGYPVENVRYSAYSEAGDIVSGGSSSSYVSAEEYDARSRTISASLPGNLLTTKRIGFHFILR